MTSDYCWCGHHKDKHRLAKFASGYEHIICEGFYPKKERVVLFGQYVSGGLPVYDPSEHDCPCEMFIDPTLEVGKDLN